MKTTYGVFDPLKGEYTIAKTKEELVSLIANTAFNFYQSQVETLYAEIQLNIDGSETWKSAKGDPMLSPQVKQEMINHISSISLMGVTVL